MLKFVSQKDFELKKVGLEQGYEIVESCNNNNCVTKNTKLIIVGTLTPPEGAGYFYTAPRNKIYGYIDQALGDTNLKEKKKQLLQNPNNEKIIEDIKQQLIKKQIAFLDIIKYAVRKKGSYLDTDIKYCTLDTNVFKKNINTVFLCNSKDSLIGFNKISEQLNIKPKTMYLSQRLATKQEWLNAIRQSLK